MGYGLDAWVAQGLMKSKETSHSRAPVPHYWVVTLQRSQSTAPSVFAKGAGSSPRASVAVNACFWESVSGQQYDVPDLRSSSAEEAPLPFLELHALFRHDCFLVNIQRSCSLVDRRAAKSTPADDDDARFFSFDICDENCWLPLPFSDLPDYNTLSFTSSMFSTLRHPGAMLPSVICLFKIQNAF